MLLNLLVPSLLLGTQLFIKDIYLGLRWPNTVFACAFTDTIQRAHNHCKNKHAFSRAIISFTQHPHYVRIFSLSMNIHVVYYRFSLLLQRYATKGNDVKSNSQLFFATKRTQFNEAHAQLLEKLRPIDFVETCRFLTILSLEFQEIRQKNSSETI